MDDQHKTEGTPAPQPQPSVGNQERQFYQPDQQTPNTATPVYQGYDLAAPTTPKEPAADVNISWEASEYIHHAKGVGWIFGLIGVTALFVALAVWQQAWTFAVLLVVMAVAIGVYAFRPPRVLHYTLTHNSLQVGDKTYSLADFRAFGIIADGAFYTIMLIPTKRFMPAVNVYFAEEDGEKIVDVLGQSLPMEQLALDSVEKLMRKLRF